MKLQKITMLLIALIFTNTQVNAEEAEYGKYGRKQVYSISKCMNNFKYCAQAQSPDVSESRRDKGERDCGEFVQFCEPIFPQVCEALKRTGYDCGTDEYLQNKFEEKTLRAIEVGENEEFIDKIKEALLVKKAEKILDIEEDKKLKEIEELEKAKELEKRKKPRKISLF